MPVHDLYSYRKRITNGDLTDVYDYDELPLELRIQIDYIWRDAIGQFNKFTGREKVRIIQNNEAWTYIHNAVAREHGVFSLDYHGNEYERCKNFLIKSDTVDKVLDLIELSFRYIDRKARKFSSQDRKLRGISLIASEAIAELNERFLRNSVGYRFENGMIFRFDSDLIHTEVVIPALQFLQQPGFEGPRDEFLQAHRHYRSGDMKAAIVDANNAFESTLKSICKQRNWQYEQGARASDLVNLVREKGLLPNYLSKSFEQLAAILKSGLPKVRNEEGAHGQGATPSETPYYVAAYALHLAAAKILFLAESHKTMG